MALSCSILLLCAWTAVLVPWVHGNPVNKPGRMCVPEGSQTSCANLEKFSGGVLTCVEVRDRLECLHKIVNGEAEMGYFDAEDLTVAAANYGGLLYSVLNEVVKEPVKAVMIQKGAKKKVIKSLCHPGYNFDQYYPLFLNRPQTDSSHHEMIETQLQKISDKYSSACIPGPWTTDTADDRKLKSTYPELCRACSGTNTCSNEKKYTGKRGSVQCVIDGAAEAAITSQSEIDNLLKTNENEIKQLSLVCQDGSLQPVSSKASACNLGSRPKPQILFLNDPELKERQSEYALTFLENLSFVNKALQLPSKTLFERKSRDESPDTIIEKTNHKVPHSEENPASPITFCVHSDAEMSKCLSLEQATHSYGLGVGIGCHQAENISHCQRDIYLGKADVMTLDGGEIYQVKKDYGFKRLISEVYKSTGTVRASNYYAVAVIKADSDITSFSQLQGKKSCHTGMGRTAGWKMPVSVLQGKRLISPKHCDYVSAMAEFFSGGSCAPGAKSTDYNQQGNYIDELCSLCTGVNENHCARGNDEPFSGYSGAFRCMATGGGDVAFVKHTTVFENTDNNNDAPWARNLRSDGFRLLCPKGGTASVTDYRDCSLALVPAHEVVVVGHMSEKRQRQVKDVLLSIASVFGKNGQGESTFKLFGAYQSGKDLLFKDSAVGLKSLSEDGIKETALKKKYFVNLNELHSCDKRICALKGQEEDCEAMAELMLKSGEQFTCVPARDKMECIQKISKGMVDLAHLPGEYLAHDLSLKVVAYMKDPSRSQEDFKYQAVTVVRKSSVSNVADLKGKKACFSNFGSSAGWSIPMSVLQKRGVVEAPCTHMHSSVQHQIVAAHVSFNRACIPGNWTTTIDSDQALKKQYEAMCSMCASEECDENDSYSGYEGALKCLTEKGGDVAFTTLSAVEMYFETTRVDRNNFAILCPNDKLVPVDSPEARECYWAAGPWDVFVTTSTTSDTKMQKLYWGLQQARIKGEEDLSSRKWYYTTLGINDEFTDISKAFNTSTLSYNSKSKMNEVSLKDICEEDPVRICTTSEDEHSKCKELKIVLEQRQITPPISCIMDEDAHPVKNCMHKISISEADVISLDGADFYEAYSTLGLEPVLSEVYGKEKASYYAVAVVRRDSGIADLAALRGKKSCHTGINKNAGWRMPVAALREQNLLDASCDFAATVGRFFNASCAPGAKLARYDPHGTNPANLCQLCVGDEANLHKCARDSQERFYSYTGAFRCLVEGGGDVAFVKHSTVPDNTDGNNLDKWSRNLHSGDYQLLCANGGPTPVEQYKHCYLEQAPAHVVVTRRSNSRWKNENIRHVLLKAAELFGKKTSFFRLFGNYFEKSDLIFKNSATGLQPANVKNYDSFIRKNKILEECT